ncbi:response regulator [Limnochorda pilosa]|uniref:Response regulator n=1 Tax=Limnochorda pilosa TaxID=1555112 RepID=A0A0K2SGR3_LIMPI|nr:response regulator [Limnochorda pilosa]BAS26301.1 response regulator [Limnochorda pilosa]
MAGESRRPLLAAIDDDPGIRYTLRSIARHAGWIMVTFPQGTTALRWLARRRPDILIIDYHLPGENGLALTRTLRQMDPELPIVVLTVDERQELADAFWEAGARDFALKPIRAPDLLARLRVHLERRREAGEARESAPRTPAGPSAGGAGSENLPKGMQQATMEAVIRILTKAPGGVAVQDVAEAGGFAPATAYRYLRHLEARRQVRVSLEYQAVGRPKKVYRLR